MGGTVAEKCSLILKVPGSGELVAEIFQILSLLTQQGMGTRFSSELGKVKGLRKGVASHLS